MPPRSTAPTSGKRNSKWGANQSRLQREAGVAARSAMTLSKSAQRKCGSMKRSCSVVPQRTSGGGRAAPRTTATSARIEQLLGEAHARVRRHLEGAELDEAEPAHGPFRRVELVDADLGAVGVAGGVDQQVAEQAVDQPGRDGCRRAAGPGASRSRARRAIRGAPRRRAAPGWSARRTGPRTGRRARDGSASRR